MWSQFSESEDGRRMAGVVICAFLTISTLQEKINTRSQKEKVF